MFPPPVWICIELNKLSNFMQTAKNSSPKIKYVFTFLVQSSASFANHMFNSNNNKENVTK